MKKRLIMGMLFVAIAISGCVRPASEVVFTEPDPDRIATAIKIIDASITPVGGENLPTYTPNPSATQMTGVTTQETVDPDMATETPTELTAEVTTAPTKANATPIIGANTSTAEPLPPTNTPTSLPPTEIYPVQQLPNYAPLDPSASFGGPRFEEDFETDSEWLTSSGKLPDSEYLKMKLVADGMSVQGMYQDFDTWFFTAPTLNDFYIEMVVDSKNCADNDAYGMIFRGAEHNQPGHGYVVGLTCNGDGFVRRIDEVNPYSAISLLLPTSSTLIATGKNQINVLGVLMEAEEISVYVNGYLFTTLYDNTYLWGRYGIFVKPGPTENYNYVINQIRVWNIYN